MKQAASARSIARARADNTARRSSIRRQVGDGDVNLADVWPTITRVVRDEQNPSRKRDGACGVAPPRDNAGSPAGMLDRPIVRALGVHYDGGVSRYQA